MKFLRENGMGIKQIAKEVGVGVGTVYSVINLKLGY
jgi:transposase